MTKAHEKLNYVEFAARDLAATKAFFTAAFGWQFADYGPDYCAFEGEGLDGGFYRSPNCAARVLRAGRSWCSTAPISRRPRAR